MHHAQKLVSIRPFQADRFSHGLPGLLPTPALFISSETEPKRAKGLVGQADHVERFGDVGRHGEHVLLPTLRQSGDLARGPAAMPSLPGRRAPPSCRAPPSSWRPPGHATCRAGDDGSAACRERGERGSVGHVGQGLLHGVVSVCRVRPCTGMRRQTKGRAKSPPLALMRQARRLQRSILPCSPMSGRLPVTALWRVPSQPAPWSRCPNTRP